MRGQRAPHRIHGAHSCNREGHQNKSSLNIYQVGFNFFDTAAYKILSVQRFDSKYLIFEKFEYAILGLFLQFKKFVLKRNISIKSGRIRSTVSEVTTLPTEAQSLSHISKLGHIVDCIRMWILCFIVLVKDCLHKIKFIRQQDVYFIHKSPK